MIVVLNRVISFIDSQMVSTQLNLSLVFHIQAAGLRIVTSFYKLGQKLNLTRQNATLYSANRTNQDGL